MTDHKKQIRNLCEAMVRSGVISRVAWEHGELAIVNAVAEIFTVNEIVIVPVGDSRTEDHQLMLAEAMTEIQKLKKKQDESRQSLIDMVKSVRSARNTLSWIHDLKLPGEG